MDIFYDDIISNDVLNCVNQIQQKFKNAKPFKHVCIDNFLSPEFIEELLHEFPSFDQKSAINEFGEVGRKAVVTDLRSIGPHYSKFYTYLNSRAFLDMASVMFGIPDLLFDPDMYGGGTHENLEGQELDPHVDFNYDQQKKWHRRVNVLIYLNKKWDEKWGGAIELHSNPWNWENNQITTFNCTFNRCVAFETNEYSWHGFKRIVLPQSIRRSSRKCISIYLYSKDRPKEEIVPLHGTFYVQRPLPETIKEGHVLTQSDVSELKNLLIKRDTWIKHYQACELKYSQEIAANQSYIQGILKSLRLPLCGYILQKRNTLEGAYADGWISNHMSVEIIPVVPVKDLIIKGWIPDNWPIMQLTSTISGISTGSIKLNPGKEFEWILEQQSRLATEFQLTIDAKMNGDNQVVNANSDLRDLAFILNEIRATH